MANFHLVCVHPFHQYTKGQTITDPALVEELSQDRDHHFVRIAAPFVDVDPSPPSLPSPDHTGDEQ